MHQNPDPYGGAYDAPQTPQSAGEGDTPPLRRLELGASVLSPLPQHKILDTPVLLCRPYLVGAFGPNKSNNSIICQIHCYRVGNIIFGVFALRVSCICGASDSLATCGAI